MDIGLYGIEVIAPTHEQLFAANNSASHFHKGSANSLASWVCTQIISVGQSSVLNGNLGSSGGQVSCSNQKRHLLPSLQSGWVAPAVPDVQTSTTGFSGLSAVPGKKEAERSSRTGIASTPSKQAKAVPAAWIADPGQITAVVENPNPLTFPSGWKPRGN